MFEVAIIFLVVLFAAWIFLYPQSTQESCAIKDCRSYLELRALENLTPENKFLERLHNEVINTLSPRPTDSTLNRHYNALVKSELATRLAAMPNS